MKDAGAEPDIFEDAELRSADDAETAIVVEELVRAIPVHDHQVVADGHVTADRLRGRQHHPDLSIELDSRRLQAPSGQHAFHADRA